MLILEAGIRECSVKKVILQISQNWQQKICARVSTTNFDHIYSIFLVFLLLTLNVGEFFVAQISLLKA